jgi:hypothetical protein
VNLVPQLAAHHATFAPPPDLFESGLLVSLVLPGLDSAKPCFRFRASSSTGIGVEGLELSRG